MPDVYEELFRCAGARLEDYVDMVRMSPNYRISFDDGPSLTMTPDLEALSAEIEAIEPGSGARLHAFLEQAGLNYRFSRDYFVERNFHSLREFLTPKHLQLLIKTRALRRLFDEAGTYFKDERLRLAFTFQTMYLGGPPTEAMAIYSLLPYTELVDGIWYPKGGIYRLVEAMRSLAEERGVVVRTGEAATSIIVDEGRATGVALASGEFVDADLVVSNVDLPTSYNRLVPPHARGGYTTRKLRSLKYTASAFMLYLGVTREYPDLAHHNVHFGADPRDNFDAIFGRNRRLPGEPALYVASPGVSDPSVAPAGSSALMVLVPVSNLDDGTDWRAAKQAFRDQVIDRLERTLLPDLARHIVVENVWTPLDWLQRFGLARGAAFGLSHNFRQVGYFRPQNKAANVPNLYFVGASTVPGTGVPMVILGSRLVTERINADLAAGRD